MLPKDLRYCLTQTIHMEYSDACSTLLFNPENYEWTRDVGDTFNIGDIYPPLVQSHSYVGKVTESLANELDYLVMLLYMLVAIMHVVQLVLVSSMIKVHYVA